MECLRRSRRSRLEQFRNKIMFDFLRLPHQIICIHSQYCVVTNMVVVGWCRRKGCGRDDIDWFIFSLLPCHAIPCDVIMNNLFLSLYLLIRLYLKIGNLSCWLWFLFLVCVSLGHFQLCLQTKLKNQTSLALKIFTGLWSLFSLNFILKVA